MSEGALVDGLDYEHDFLRIDVDVVYLDGRVEAFRPESKASIGWLRYEVARNLLVDPRQVSLVRHGRLLLNDRLKLLEVLDGADEAVDGKRIQAILIE